MSEELINYRSSDCKSTGGSLVNGGFFRRSFAFFIDHLIVLCFIIFLFDQTVKDVSDLINILINITNLKFGIIIAINILFFEIYFTIFEWLWKGRTPGKWLCGLEVVRDNGEKIGFYPSIIRNFLRCIYFIPPLFFIPDIVSLIISDKNKRIGDYWAGTRVIQKKAKEDQHFTDAESLPETKDN